MPHRRPLLAGLLAALQAQVAQGYAEKVELLVDSTEDLTVGGKRNKLLRQSQGLFVVFVDDDDEVTEDYVSTLVGTMEQHPLADCIGLEGWITFDGDRRQAWKISRTFDTWHEKEGVYYRTPNHISPVRRELALLVGFPDLSFGEDAEYSRRLLPLLKTEAYIPRPLYHYKFISNKWRELKTLDTDTLVELFVNSGKNFAKATGPDGAVLFDHSAHFALYNQLLQALPVDHALPRHVAYGAHLRGLIKQELIARDALPGAANPQLV